MSCRLCAALTGTAYCTMHPFVQAKGVPWLRSNSMPTNNIASTVILLQADTVLGGPYQLSLHSCKLWTSTVPIAALQQQSTWTHSMAMYLPLPTKNLLSLFHLLMQALRVGGRSGCAPLLPTAAMPLGALQQQHDAARSSRPAVSNGPANAHRIQTGTGLDK
jgi:hypothetical protein